jgi:uncharacterized protein YqhQ
MSEPARPYIGGQAVIEGVMMRSPGSFAIVCRRKSGELVVREQPMEQPEVTGLRKLPFVRGLATVVESLRLGSRALRWSAELFEQDYMAEDDAAGSPPAGAKGAEAKREGAAKAEKASRLANVLSALTLPIVSLATLDPKAEPSGGKGGGGAAMILPIAFALFLFVLLPQAAAEGAVKLFGWKDVSTTSPLFQAITGGMKLCIVIGYLAAIRRVAEIRRVFEYHGAEHKTISTYEAGEPLVVENARAKTTLHPRCGTTFLVMVALVSIAVFSLAGAFLPRIPGGRLVEHVGLFAMKLPFLPVIAAITYEIQRVFARYCTVGPLRVLLWPGFLVQKITTAEPDDAELEVALASLRATLWREERKEAPVRPDRTFESYETLLADPGYAA